MSKTRQSGSVTTFIIIGAVLAVITIGTAYAVVRRGEQVRRDQAIASADQSAKTTDNKTTPASTSNSDKTSTQPSSDSAETAASATADNTASQSQTPADLPVTGPELSPIATLPIALIAGCAVAYNASRRRSIRSL